MNMPISCRRHPAGFLALVVALLAVALGPALADERLLNFDSRVVVQADASLTVTETLTVRSEGREIKRGIVRDFPTTYRDRLGHWVRVGFEVVEVRRDGKSEPFRVESASGGKRIRIGRKETFLKPGVHTVATGLQLHGS